MFKRKKPCKTCPFRTNEEGVRYLGQKRAEEITDTLLGDETFTCHDDLGLTIMERQHCVGAMLMLEKQQQPNQMMRIAGRLGEYKPDELTGADEVFDDFEDWIECQSMDC